MNGIDLDALHGRIRDAYESGHRPADHFADLSLINALAEIPDDDLYGNAPLADLVSLAMENLLARYPEDNA